MKSDITVIVLWGKSNCCSACDLQALHGHQEQSLCPKVRLFSLYPNRSLCRDVLVSGGRHLFKGRKDFMPFLLSGAGILSINQVSLTWSASYCFSSRVRSLSLQTQEGLTPLISKDL